MVEQTQTQDPNTQDPKGTDEGKENVTFSKEQQDHLDNLIGDRLKKANDKREKELEDLKAQHKKELEEVEKKSKLKADELKKYEDDKLKEELETYKKDAARREFLDNSRVVLKDCKVDSDLHFLFEKEDALDNVKENATKFVKIFEEKVLEEVNKRMGGHQQKQSTTTTTDEALRAAMGLK